MGEYMFFYFLFYYIVSLIIKINYVVKKIDYILLYSKKAHRNRKFRIPQTMRVVVEAGSMVECFFFCLRGACEVAGKLVSDDVGRDGRKVGVGPLLDGQVADDGAHHVLPLQPGHFAAQILIGRQILNQL